jgi:transcriptional regulator with XRE-family HTH domain
VTQSKRPPATPDPITRAIGSRVLRLRKGAGMNQAELGERMAARGLDWSRTSVQKLETGRRGAITVQELLALAHVFDVPLVWLLADPEVGDPVPIAKDVEVDPWLALLWMIGKQPLRARPGWAWDGPALVLERLLAVVAGVDEYRRYRRTMDDLRVRAQKDPDTDDLGRRLQKIEQNPEVEKDLLESIARKLRELADWDLAVPPLPPDVRERAVALGVELPEQKG